MTDMSIDTEPQQQEASPQVVVRRSSSRYQLALRLLAPSGASRDDQCRRDYPEVESAISLASPWMSAVRR